jgi:hypothetical protein
MICPRYWIKHLLARRALRGYPLYDVPHKRAEKTMTEAEAQENFDYFMSVRLGRFAFFVDWMRRNFAVEATLDGEGLTAVSNWADDYGGGLIQYPGHLALDIWANYCPIWDSAHAGFNVMIDVGIFQGEYLTAKRPKLLWEIYRGHEIEPTTFGSTQLLKPCVGGFPRFWKGFPLRAGASAVINGRGISTVGDHMARSGALILDAKQNLHLSNFADGEDPLIIGDYRNEPI